MKKSNMRLLALMICTVMVLCMVPGKAEAVTLEGHKMSTMNDGGDGIFTFTTSAELKEIANQAANNPDTPYLAFYAGSGKLTISDNLTIPNNFVICMEGKELVISYGATVEIAGTLQADDTTVNGTVNVLKGGGALLFTNNLVVSGTIHVEGSLITDEALDFTITGRENIHMEEYGSFRVEATNPTSAELVELCEYGAEVLPLDFPDTISVHIEEPIMVDASLTVAENVEILIYESMTIHGDLYLEGLMVAKAPLNLMGKVTNLGLIEVIYDDDEWHENNGRMNFAKPEKYEDIDAEKGGGWITVTTKETEIPADALGGMSPDDFYTVYYYEDWDCWGLFNYKRSHKDIHYAVEPDPAVEPTCLTYGSTEGSHCIICGEVLVKPEALAPLGHMYSDFWDDSCDVCGDKRVINPSHLTSSMYRMYNPNTGEHFYTGSLEERQVIEAAGWKYEGVGFTICANEGDPVFRLFDPASGEHLYTMDVAERDMLVAKGWNMEGIAFNSCPNKDVPQYRLWNPNATVGAYHFTASMEERDVLLAAGWQDQGIGFYSCWQ